MHPQIRMVRQALGLGLVMSLVLLALGSCGALGSQEQANQPRPLPEYPQDLRAGEYHTKAFKPSVSFSVGKGWALQCPLGPDFVCLSRGAERIRFSPSLMSTMSTSPAGVGQ